MKKRGQITIFIVVVLIVIIIASLIISSNRKDVSPETSTKVPTKLQPVNTLVENCIKDVTRNGLDELMAHGGYIYTDTLEVNPLEPTESEAIEFVPDSNYLIPYWYYMESDNDCRSNCQFSTKRKPLCKTGREECITNGEDSKEELDLIDENLQLVLQNGCYIFHDPLNCFDVKKIPSDEFTPLVAFVVQKEETEKLKSY